MPSYLSSVSRKILLSRFLTRAGDQAWDFAVPIVILKSSPGQLQIAASYYLFSRLGLAFAMPRFASLIDRVNRGQAVRMGIGLQSVCVVIAALVIGTGLFEAPVSSGRESFSFSIQALGAPWMMSFLLLVIAGIGSSLGAAFMEIAIANDLVPAAIPEGELPKFNSRMRQLDLLAEVAAPVVAGSLLLIPSNWSANFGFYVIAAWNVVSFIPEAELLRSVFKVRPDLLPRPSFLDEKAIVSSAARQSLFARLSHGWRSFLRQPVALVIASYAFLWFSVLSPHGVLLTGFLKGGWRLPEIAIGSFRALGAAFGLLATWLFPLVTKRLGLLKGSQLFLALQAGTLLVALPCFLLESPEGQVGFLFCILLSRVGLYGFSLGELQIRQTGIEPGVRGEVNGFASALTSLATLALYGAGSLLPSTQDFSFLVFASVASVCAALMLYSYWLSKARVPLRQ